MPRVLEFLKKNWLIIILAVAPPIVIWYFLQREYLELTVTVRVDVPVVSVRKEYGDEIELRYKGTQVSGLRVVELEVANTGNKPIERSAFDSSVMFAFGPARVTEPVVLNTYPTSLQPILYAKDDIISLNPLLLNSKDRFTFRFFVVGGTEVHPITVSGRIRGISEIQLEAPSDDKANWTMVLAIVGAILGIIMSSASFVRLGISVSRLRVSLPMGLVVELSNRLEKDPRTAAKAVQLAKELEISQHDSKANLLFLRLKIESLLRDLARRADLPRSDQVGSIRRLSEQLVRQGIITQDIAAVIADISPSLNRELHEADSNLSEEEFVSLQRLGLNVIAALTMALERHSKKQRT